MQSEKKWLLCFVCFFLCTAFLFSGGQKEEAAQTTEGSSAVTLTWMDYNGYNLEIQDAVLHELKDTDNINVEIQHLANDYTTQLKTRINAGETPDIFITTAGTDNETYSEYTYDLTGKPVLNKFLDWTLEYVKHNGRVTGLPVNIESFALIHNEKLFAQAGIQELPKTMSELEAVCKNLQAQGITPFSNGYKEFWVIFQHQVTPFMGAFMEKEGITPKQLAEKLESGEISFETIDYFDKYLDYIDLTVKYGQPKPLETGWEAEEVAVATDKAAMMHMGAWCEPVLKKANPDVDVAFLPTPLSVDPSDARVSSSVSWVARISKTSDHIDEAIKVVDHFLTSDSGLNYTVKESGWVLPLKNVPVEPEGLLVTSVKQILADSEPYPWAFLYWPSGFNEAAGSIMQAYVAGIKDRDEVKKDITEKYLELSN